jgi:hypothetical protein
MKNLYDMVVEAVTALNNGFSAHNVTQWVRQMASLAQQNNEDLDLPLSTDPAFKWYVSHREVKKYMEQLFNSGMLTRTASGNGYFVYELAMSSTSTNTTGATGALGSGISGTAGVPTTPAATLLGKLLNYVNGYRSRCGFSPTAKKVQSRLKRDCNLTCQQLLAFAQQNNVPVKTSGTPSASTVG